MPCCLPLQSPQPFGKWKGVLDATRPVPKCVQRNVYVDEQEVSGQEDCLFINVYTPHVSISTSLILLRFSALRKVWHSSVLLLQFVQLTLYLQLRERDTTYSSTNILEEYSASIFRTEDGGSRLLHNYLETSYAPSNLGTSIRNCQLVT
jgi:hypothetical protein